MRAFSGLPGAARAYVDFRDPTEVSRIISEFELDKSTTPQVRDELSTVATGLIPALAEYPIEKHWAGLRPGSPDGIPYISACPGAEGLFVNAGHFRNGVVMGLAAAHLGADLILNRETIVNPLSYQVGTR